MVEFVEIPPDDPSLRPVYNQPPCPGIDTHPWYLTISEGRLSLTSHCEECNEAVMGPVGGEDVEMIGHVIGRLHSHLERVGYEIPEYDHWWEFIPERIADDG